MATHAHNYRPRYSYEEINPLNPANQPIRSWPSVIGSCLCSTVTALGPIFCANRKRGAVSVGAVALLALALINFIAPRIYETSGHIGSHKMATRESLGLYRDIAGRRWADLRDKAREARRQSSRVTEPNAFAAAKDFHEKYKIEFDCPNEKLVGGSDGGNSAGGSAWFICNPQGMPGAYRARQAEKRKVGLLGFRKAKKGCLIYTSKRTSTLGFETALPNQCEIHVFAPGEISDATRINANLQSNIHLHDWGFKGISVQTNPGGGQFMTFQETVKELGHTDRDIDLLVLDCVGCEWDVMKDILPVSVQQAAATTTSAIAEGVGDIMQIVVNLYEKPASVNDLFQAIKLNNYAIFHKEVPAPAATENKFGFSFIKLAPEFWKEPVDL
jgi:hypothetical protein